MPLVFNNTLGGRIRAHPMAIKFEEMCDMFRLLLLRHGESVWNRDNRFTGWTDVVLSEAGVREAEEAGRLLRDGGYEFDLCFTSLLRRGIRTLDIVLDVTDQLWLPVHKTWRLNERHYGALQGLNKEEMRRKAGPEQVHTWRRSYAVRPPPLDPDDPSFPGNDRSYADVGDDELPGTESLEDTVKRTLPYWHEVVAPAIRDGARVLISAHGNSLRGLVKYLDDVPDEDIPAVEIPTGRPLVFELNSDLKAVRHFYLERGTAAAQ